MPSDNRAKGEKARATGGSSAVSSRLAALALSIAALAGFVAAQGKAATLKVADAAPRAEILVDGVRMGRVDDNGARTIATLLAGRHAVTVRQFGFADFDQTVALAAGTPAVVRPKKVALRDEAELAAQRGEDLWLDNKFSDAAAQFRAAIDARGGRYAAAQIGLARALFGLKHFDEASDVMIALIAADARSAEAHTVLANCLRERGIYDEAEAEYRKAIALAPSRAPEAHTGLAILLDDAGKGADAVAEFRKAIAQNNDAEPLLYQLLGSALERLDDRTAAAAAYERYLALAPEGSLAPAVRSLLDRLRASPASGDEDSDVNPYAPH